jgi:hypothetical protein
MLYVNIVPEDRRTEYLALYYAWIGFVGGCGPLLAGSLLDGFSALRGNWGFLRIDPYTPLLAGSVAAITVSALVLQRLRVRLAREPLAT